MIWDGGVRLQYIMSFYTLSLLLLSPILLHHFFSFFIFKKSKLMGTLWLLQVYKFSLFPSPTWKPKPTKFSLSTFWLLYYKVVLPCSTLERCFLEKWHLLPWRKKKKKKVKSFLLSVKNQERCALWVRNVCRDRAIFPLHAELLSRFSAVWRVLQNPETQCFNGTKYLNLCLWFFFSLSLLWFLFGDLHLFDWV